MDKRTDTAAEPVEPQDDEFMDTGVLHERPKKQPRFTYDEDTTGGQG